MVFASAGFPAAKDEGGRYKPVFEREFHVSGHASREDLTGVIDQIDPDRIVPIFTQARGWFADRFEDVVLAEGGWGSSSREGGVGDAPTRGDLQITL